MVYSVRGENAGSGTTLSTDERSGRLTGIEGFPETFFVDKNGNIVGETYSGSRSLEDWLTIVEQELANLKEGN